MVEPYQQPASSLTRVMNATGIVIHTNLGRAPLGAAVSERLSETALGYSNLEFDLKKGIRGNRQDHLRPLLKEIIGAEDVLVANNNAAALLLVLSTFAREREVIVSRGELIEIGGSFRIPDIMAESGARLVEVGSTNCTRIEDFQEAVSSETAMIFKAHASNYHLTGKYQSVDITELVALGQEREVMVVYDLGSGMLRRPEGLPLQGEETVQEMIAAGVDLITFSGDKMLGGPQAGVMAGRSDLIGKLAKAPLMRALRPGKLNLAGLAAAVGLYLNDQALISGNPAFAMLARSSKELKSSAEHLSGLLHEKGVPSRIEESSGQVGGGALPGLELAGWAVQVMPPEGTRKEGELFAERLLPLLLQQTPPVLGVLREGRLLLDVRTLSEEELPVVAQAVANACA